MWVEAWGLAFPQPEWLPCAQQAGLALPKGQKAAVEAQVAQEPLVKELMVVVQHVQVVEVVDHIVQVAVVQEV